MHLIILIVNILTLGNQSTLYNNQVKGSFVDFIILSEDDEQNDYKINNTHYIKLSEVKKYQKEILSIDLSFIKYRRFPNELRPLVNLKRANFQTLETFVLVNWAHSRECEGFLFNIESKIKALPKWIPKLQEIEYLNLVGHNKLNFRNEIKKIKKMTKLVELEIEIRKLNFKVIEKLIQETTIKKLVLHKENVTEEEKNILKKLKEQQNVDIELKEIIRK